VNVNLREETDRHTDRQTGGSVVNTGSNGRLSLCVVEVWVLRSMSVCLSVCAGKASETLKSQKWARLRGQSDPAVSVGGKVPRRTLKVYYSSLGGGLRTARLDEGGRFGACCCCATRSIMRRRTSDCDGGVGGRGFGDVLAAGRGRDDGT